jgi:hypothetical protein
LLCRSTFVFNQLRLQFNLTKKVQVNLQVYPEMAGEIQLNTIQPASYPWSGTYFDGVPIQMEPVAKPGYVFSHWLPAANIVDSLADSLSVFVTQTNQTFTAVFKVVPLPPDPPYIEFSVQPNPSNGLFSVWSTNKDLAKDCQYFIYDLQGRVIQKGPISDTYETILDLTVQRAAVYWLTIYKGEDKLQTLELLKY